MGTTHKEFELIEFNGHLLIEEEGEVMLIDTGSPSTIHRNNSLQFMWKTYRTQSEYLGLTLPKLCGLLRKEVSTLIGMDILSE